MLTWNRMPDVSPVKVHLSGGQQRIAIWGLQPCEQPASFPSLPPPPPPVREGEDIYRGEMKLGGLQTKSPPAFHSGVPAKKDGSLPPSCWALAPSTVQFKSAAQSCPTLFDAMDCSTPGLPIHHQGLLKLMSIESVMSSTISSSVVPFFSRLQFFPASGSFLMSQFLASGGQSTGVSASASVLPMNIQDWSPLGWTGWISLQSKRLSRVFSNTTVQNHQFFGTWLSL